MDDNQKNAAQEAKEVKGKIAEMLDNKQIEGQDMGVLAQIAEARFVAAQQLVKNELNTLSKRGILRALFAALNLGVNDSNFKFEKATEAKAAGILAQALDLRNVLLAEKLQRSEETDNKETSNNSKGDKNDE